MHTIDEERKNKDLPPQKLRPSHNPNSKPKSDDAHKNPNLT